MQHHPLSSSPASSSVLYQILLCLVWGHRIPGCRSLGWIATTLFLQLTVFIPVLCRSIMYLYKYIFLFVMACVIRMACSFVLLFRPSRSLFFMKVYRLAESWFLVFCEWSEKFVFHFRNAIFDEDAMVVLLQFVDQCDRNGDLDITLLDFTTMTMMTHRKGPSGKR